MNQVVQSAEIWHATVHIFYLVAGNSLDSLANNWDNGSSSGVDHANLPAKVAFYLGPNSAISWCLHQGNIHQGSNFK
jgi:hypothetical protein